MHIQFYTDKRQLIYKNNTTQKLQTPRTALYNGSRCGFKCCQSFDIQLMFKH